jgi:hypothetical protein
MSVPPGQPSVVKVLVVEQAVPNSPQPVVEFQVGMLVLTELGHDPPPVGALVADTMADWEATEHPSTHPAAPIPTENGEPEHWFWVLHMLLVITSTCDSEQIPVGVPHSHVQVAGEAVGALVPLIAELVYVVPPHVGAG